MQPIVRCRVFSASRVIHSSPTTVILRDSGSKLKWSSGSVTVNAISVVVPPIARWARGLPGNVHDRTFHRTLMSAKNGNNIHDDGTTGNGCDCEPTWTSVK